MAMAGLLLAGGCDRPIRPVGPPPPPDETGRATADTGGRAVPSCDRREAMGICEDYVGSGWDEATRAADCSGTNVLSGSSCPPSGLGGCDQTREDPLGTFVWYYVGAFWTEDQRGWLEFQCTSRYDNWIEP